jgi:hypothetical protein
MRVVPPAVPGTARPLPPLRPILLTVTVAVTVVDLLARTLRAAGAARVWRCLLRRAAEGGSDRGALSGSRPVGFPGPPSAPAVRLSPQRALHMSCQLVSR